MDTQSQILTVQLEFEGRTYTASYFLEQDIIQASMKVDSSLRSKGPTLPRRRFVRSCSNGSSKTK